MEFFDNRNSLGYDKYYRGHTNFSKILLDLCAEETPRILEIGIGTGNEAENLINLLEGRGSKFQFYGLDKSKILLKICRKKLGSKVTLIETDAEKRLSFTQKFNLIYLAFVYHLISNKQGLFQECHRLLKPNGKLVIYSSSHYDLKQHILNKYFPSKLGIDSKRYLSDAELKKILLDSGFQNFKKKRIIRDRKLSIDEKFLEGVRSGVSNSVVQIIRNNSPEEYKKGIQLLKEDLSKRETYDVYKTIYLVSKS
jgi:ubiquinone/menaquinone biosynthesis C-methylase UbiE